MLNNIIVTLYYKSVIYIVTHLILYMKIGCLLIFYMFNIMRSNKISEHLDLRLIKLKIRKKFFFMTVNLVFKNYSSISYF